MSQESEALVIALTIAALTFTFTGYAYVKHRLAVAAMESSQERRPALKIEDGPVPAWAVR